MSNFGFVGTQWPKLCEALFVGQHDRSVLSVTAQPARQRGRKVDCLVGEVGTHGRFKIACGSGCGPLCPPALLLGSRTRQQSCLRLPGQLCCRVREPRSGHCRHRDSG